MGLGGSMVTVGSRDLELFLRTHGVSCFMQEKASSNPILDPTPQAALLAFPRAATAAIRESLQLPF